MNMNFLDPNIDDLEFCRRFTAAAEAYVESASIEDFEPNPVQIAKFHKLVDFFEQYAKTVDGHFEDININPVFGVGDVTVDFVVFDLSGDEIQRFCDVLRACSAISMDANDAGEVCISCTVPDCFILKSN